MSYSFPIRQDSNTRFPRIKRLSQYDSNNNNSNNNSSNTEQFFSNNYKLFIYSLRFTFDVNRDGNIDELDLLLTLQDASLFIKEFLPLSQLGLLKALGAVRLFICIYIFICINIYINKYVCMNIYTNITYFIHLLTYTIITSIVFI